MLLDNTSAWPRNRYFRTFCQIFSRGLSSALFYFRNCVPSMPWRDPQEPLVVKKKKKKSTFNRPFSRNKISWFRNSFSKKLHESNSLQRPRRCDSSELAPIMCSSAFSLSLTKWSIDEAALWPRRNKWELVMFEGNGIKGWGQKGTGGGNIRIYPAAQWTAFQREVVLCSCTTKRQMVSMAPHVSKISQSFAVLRLSKSIQ